MTVQDQAAPSVVERLRNTFSDWLKHGRELSEMRQLNSTDFCRIANDLRLSPTELDVKSAIRHRFLSVRSVLETVLDGSSLDRS